MQHSDLSIPSPSALTLAALDARDTAERIGDAASVKQIDRLIVAIVRGAGFAWELGTLIVTSPSGFTYEVTRAGCNCLNGQHGRRQCWHWIARGILEDQLLERSLA